THQVDISWAGSPSLPAPSLSGSSATYADALPGVDVVVRALRQGFEYSLVLHTQAAALALATSVWPFTATGLRAGQDSSGGVSLKNALGTVVGFVSQPVVFDAQRDPATGDPKNISSGTLALSSGASGLALTRACQVVCVRA
ncbi:MAG: hypothetical protein M3O32_22590, partial [Actinomycetota bacterium]|nr:hypothetical protein [Actinomycetota bacterium]